MDEAENVAMEEICWIENNDNGTICSEGDTRLERSTDGLGFGIDDSCGIRTDTTGIPRTESVPLEYSALTTKDQENRTNSEFGISGSESFDTERFDGTNLAVHESECNNGVSSGNAAAKLTKQSLPEKSEKAEETHDSPEVIETRSIFSSGKVHSQGQKHYVPPGLVYHGESDGYRYYIGCSGEIYSVDRNGYWYMQDGNGSFISCNGYQYNRGAHSSLFPRDSQGRFTLPTNSRSEKAFPVDANNIPIFPFDTTTNLPTFPVDENGQPVFPTGALGRPVVPVDTNGLAVFPRDANGRFIFPSGPNGRPTAPVNIYGVPVMPLDEQGKPVVPYDASGMPLIHLASDGITPLTEEEYQYSLQWNEYYSRYYTNATEHKIGGSSHSTAQPTSSDTYEQKAKNMKLLRKIRPEDIDLPPSVPPPPSTQPPPPSSDGSALSGETEKKTTSDPALKAKTKKMIEMQLKFSRKKLRDTVFSSAAAAVPDEINMSAEHVPLLLPLRDSPENIGKVESPKECSPPPPTHTPGSDASLPVEPYNNIEAVNSTFDNMGKSLNPENVQKINRNSYEDWRAKEQITVLDSERAPMVLNVLGSTIKLSSGVGKDSQNSKTSSNLYENLMNELQVDCQVSGKEGASQLDKCLFETGVGEVTSGKKLVAADVSVGLDVVMEKKAQDKDDNEEEKMAAETGPSVGCESKIENQILPKCDEKNELTLISSEIEKLRHHSESKGKKRRSESGHRRSRRRSLYRDSHRRSRSRGMKFRNRSRSRTPPRDYCYRSNHRSRSRDQFYKRKGSYYDRRSHRRYRTPDAEDRYSYPRRHSSSREKSSRQERSTSRDLTPAADKSSRSHSYCDQSKSRTESPLVSRHSSIERSVSQCKTTDSRDRSSSRNNSPEYDTSRITEHKSVKSQRLSDLEFICDALKIKKSANHTLSPHSEKGRSVERLTDIPMNDAEVKIFGKELELKTEKSKKHKKTKEKHRKRKKSHHKKRDKKKPSPCRAESDLDEKYRASSFLSDETDLNMNASLSQLADDGPETFFNTQKEANDRKNDKTKKKKEKIKKKERRNTSTEGSDVTKKASRETLEDGEIITEKDFSPRVREKMVNYTTYESEEEKNNVGESKNPADKLVENSKIKDVPFVIKLAMNSKAPGIAAKSKDFIDVDIRSSVLSSDLVDKVLEIPPGSTGMSKMEKEANKNSETMNLKHDARITVDLEDDGIPGRHKDSIINFTEITAREAEKLKAENITETMNKLKEMRGYVQSNVTVSKSTPETEATEQLNNAGDKDSAFAGRVQQTVISGVRFQEACASAKIDLKDRRKKETHKRKWEEDEEAELSRLRYEALRSKTRRLMNDLKAERRRLKRERLRATIAMRRARERSLDTSVDEILLADTSESSETDASEDYSSSHKSKLLKRKRYGRETIIVHSNQNKQCGSKNISDDDDVKEQQKHQKAASSGFGEQLESCAPNNLIMELQQRIGGSNESALALLEQLKKCLSDGAVSSTIHLNPEMIRKNA